jgi:hypothetical protein
MADRDDLADLVRAVDRLGSLLEHRVAPALERIAASIGQPSPVHDRAGAARQEALLALRLDLAASSLELAGSLIEAFAAAFPDAPELDDLRAEIETRRVDHTAALRRRVDAGREAGEPEEVLAARDELARHLDDDGLREIDAAVLTWLVGLIQARMRSGTVGLDVAQWAGEVVARYGDSREGQALHASLPILRRCAGLCARCGEPYRGIEAACPRCLHAAAAVTAAQMSDDPGSSREPDPDEEDAADPESWDEAAGFGYEDGPNGFLDSDPHIGPG